MGLAEDLNQISIDTGKLHDVVHGSIGEIIPTDGGDLITVATALDEITNFIPRGDWTTSTAYSKKDLVRYSDDVYVVISDHTSGVFATDLANGLLAVYQNTNSTEALEAEFDQFVLDLSSTTEGEGVDFIGNAIKKVNGVTNLRLTLGTNTPIIYLTYHTINTDGGHGFFYWNSSSTASDNNGTVIAVTGIGTGRWVRHLDDAWVTLEMFGGRGDDSFDNTSVWTNIIGAFDDPCIKLGRGIYRGRVSSGNKTIKILGAGYGASETFGDNLSTIKNNASGYRLIDVADSENVDIRGVTIDNAGYASNALYLDHAYFVYLDEVGVVNFGNNTTPGTYGVYVDSCTKMRIGRLNFRHPLNGGYSTYGGCLYINTANYMQIDYIGAKGAGTDTSAIEFNFLNIFGGNIGVLQSDTSGGGGHLSITGHSLSINQLAFENNDSVPCTAASYITVASMANFSVLAGRFADYADTTANKPFFGLSSTTAFSLTNFQFHRQSNEGSVPFITLDNNSNRSLTFTNLSAENQNVAGSSNVPFTFIDTDANITSSIVFDTFHTEGTASHILTGAARSSIRNVKGTISPSSGAIIDSPTVYPLTSAEVSVRGNGAIFQHLEMHRSSGTLSGATGTISLILPEGCQIMGVALRVDTNITGVTTWTAAFSGGSTTTIGTWGALTKNNKRNVMFSTLPVTTTWTDITLTAGGGVFTGGQISCVVSYVRLTDMADAP